MKPTQSNPRNLTRRDALTISGSSAVGGGLLGLGCTSGSASPQGPGVGGAGRDSQTAAGNLSCVLTPEATEGPFFVDERLNRADLTANETDPAVLGGYPLALNFTVMAIGAGVCQPLAGAFVDIWHANVNGLYPDEAPTMFQMTDTSGAKYLRGYQVTDGAGAVAFRTIYPGWYLTRTVHIHFKIRLFGAAGNKTVEASGQMYFGDTMNDTIFALPPYVGRGARTIPMNTNDQVFNGTGPGSGIDTVGLPPGQVPPGQMTIAATTPASGSVGQTATLKIGLQLS